MRAEREGLDPSRRLPGGEASAQIGLSYIGEFYNQSRIDDLMQAIARPALDRRRAARPKSDREVLNFGARPRSVDDATNAEQRDQQIQFK